MPGLGPHVLGVDGGNSKSDVVLASADGTCLAAARGPSVSHQAVGLEAGMSRLATLLSEARAVAGDQAAGPADVAVLCLAGADTAADVRLLESALGGLGLARRVVLRNDTLAVLRSGTDSGWGVAVICGAGVNAAGIAPNGRTARLAALGEISGDWGGGTDVAWAGLAAAVRGRDGRGPRTVLERVIPSALGLGRPSSVTHALYTGRLDDARVRDLAPVVFQAAIDGDAAARSIIDRLADEVVAMARAMLTRLHLARTVVDVVLGGGVMRTPDSAFHDRIREGIHHVAPTARIIVPRAPPVLGATLLALDELGGDPGARSLAATRLRAALEAWRA
jgi:N-acetylglucosamine kinase-like BadF-type ATPase